MRLLDRYLLRELLTPFGYCLGGFLIIWISFDLSNELNDLQESRLHAGDIVEYYLVKSPEFLVEVLPMMDLSERTALLGAKLIREALLTFCK